MRVGNHWGVLYPLWRQRCNKKYIIKIGIPLLTHLAKASVLPSFSTILLTYFHNHYHMHMYMKCFSGIQSMLLLKNGKKLKVLF